MTANANISHDELLYQFEEIKSNIDQLFLIICGMFVLLMQAGFAFLEAGSIRSKNTTNIIMKNVLDMFIGALAFWAVGYSFAYGVPGNGFIGHKYFFSSNVVWNESEVTGSDVTGSGYYAMWFYHFVFAATASTIVSGAMAERTEFVAYLVYCFFLTAFVYPIVAHWCWAPDGWLKSGAGTGLSYQDFAGSGVVHITGGTAAFVGAVIIGPRIGRFDEDGTVNMICGHSVTVASLGAFILFVGFMAFNGGSQLQISAPGDGKVLALAVVNTIISGAASALTAMLIFKLTDAVLRKNKSYWSLIISINGGLTGMVAICAGCNDVYPWSALLIGIVTGCFFIGWHHLMIHLRVDDPLDAVAVHFGGGITGVLTTPIFAINGLKSKDGSFVGGIAYSSDIRAYQQFGWNLIGAFCIAAWTAGISFLMFGSMKLLGVLRVSERVELCGLDDVKHGEPAYPLSSYQDGHIPCAPPSFRPSKVVSIDETVCDGNVQLPEDTPSPAASKKVTTATVVIENSATSL